MPQLNDPVTLRVWHDNDPEVRARRAELNTNALQQGYANAYKSFIDVLHPSKPEPAPKSGSRMWTDAEIDDFILNDVIPADLVEPKSPEQVAQDKAEEQAVRAEAQAAQVAIEAKAAKKLALTEQLFTELGFLAEDAGQFLDAFPDQRVTAKAIELYGIDVELDRVERVGFTPSEAPTADTTPPVDEIVPFAGVVDPPNGRSTSEQGILPVSAPGRPETPEVVDTAPKPNAAKVVAEAMKEKQTVGFVSTPLPEAQ